MKATARKRSGELQQLRRREIAEAACDAIIDGSLERLRLSDVAERAGITTGAIQYHFRSKEDLLLFMKNQLFDQVFGEADRAAQGHYGPERLRVFIRTLLPIRPTTIRAYQLLEAFRGRAIGNSELLQSQAQRDMQWLAKLANEIRALQEEGHISRKLNADREALGLNALIDGLGALIVIAPAQFKVEDVVSVADTWLSKSLGLPPTPANAEGAHS